MKRYLVGLLLGLTSTLSLACYTAPKEQLVTADALLASSKTVVLATAIRAELRDDGTVSYTFVVKRRYAGNAGEIVTLLGYPMAGGSDGSEPDRDHVAPTFWSERGGRSGNGADCLIHPDFVVGATYLLFLDAPFTRKSFERISRNGSALLQDRWLAYVDQYFSTRDSRPK